MPARKANLLVVDDDAPIRELLSIILTGCGYEVRSAHDGFSALMELREQLPDIIVSDLNMPLMSGFEFLSVVRRRFPRILVIAMSGAFSGNSVPDGVVADAFYEKGGNVGLLIETLKIMTGDEKFSCLRQPGQPITIWIPLIDHQTFDADYVMITCPECLRTFPQILAPRPAVVHTADCVHCLGLITYAIVQPEMAVVSETNSLLQQRDPVPTRSSHTGSA